jgi:hypothetical protein
MTCVRLFRHRRPPPTRAFPVWVRFACRSYDLQNLRWAGELSESLYREPLVATRKDIPGDSIFRVAAARPVGEALSGRRPRASL